MQPQENIERYRTSYGDSIPVTLDDCLSVHVQNVAASDTLLLNYILLRDCDGELLVVTKQIPANQFGSTTNRAFFRLIPGRLLSVQLNTLNTSPQSGEMLVIVDLWKNADPNNPDASGFAYKTLISDYVTPYFKVSWPAQSGRGPNVERYAPLMTTIPAPAAGALPGIASNQQQYQEILAVKFSLTTSATVANRHVRIRVQDAGIPTPLWWAISGFLQVASKTVNYYFIQGGQFSNVTLNGGTIDVSAPLPILAPWEGGYRFTLYPDALDAADQFSSVVIYSRQQARQT